ncbi:organic hydroperoxide resistance protein [Eisenibacter elegans]|jgi:Ohr subfamily peroxiredoxin|uniref:organic hydroperoxide resistance protein n=1 Tax=Eisenibacter elegans TaxID=997 RepID=UPI000429353F|nr:organic hydroperoxide resistance protein [Eisenibacter elegans]
MSNLTPIYTAEVVSTGGRNGQVKSSDGVLDLLVRMPTAMQGPGGEFTNPEQLFAAGYAACFGGAIGAVAKGRNVSGAAIRAQVTLGKRAEGGFGLAAILEVHLPNLSLAEAQQVVDDAHQVCPYSLATRGNIEVVVKAVAEAPTL